jgi:hypothetical protein
MPVLDQLDAGLHQLRNERDVAAQSVELDADQEALRSKGICWPYVPPDNERAGETFSPSSHSDSQTSAGKQRAPQRDDDGSEGQRTKYILAAVDAAIGCMIGSRPLSASATRGRTIMANGMLSSWRLPARVH